MKKEGEKEVKLALQGYVTHMRKGEIKHFNIKKIKLSLLGLRFFNVNVIM